MPVKKLFQSNLCYFISCRMTHTFMYTGMDMSRVPAYCICTLIVLLCLYKYVISLITLHLTLQSPAYHFFTVKLYIGCLWSLVTFTGLCKQFTYSKYEHPRICMTLIFANIRKAFGCSINRRCSMTYNYNLHNLHN